MKRKTLIFGLVTMIIATDTTTIGNTKIHKVVEQTIAEETKEELKIELDRQQARVIQRRLEAKQETEKFYKWKKEEQKRKAKEEEEKKRQEEMSKQNIQKQMLARFTNEADLLAKILYCEAGSTEFSQSNYYDMIYTVSVVINRARTKFGIFSRVNTIREVLNQPGQYSEITIKKIETGIEAPPSCKEMVTKILNGEIPILYEGVLNQTGFKIPEEEWQVTEISLPYMRQHYAIPNKFETNQTFEEWYNETFIPWYEKQ